MQGRQVACMQLLSQHTNRVVPWHPSQSHPHPSTSATRAQWQTPPHSPCPASPPHPHPPPSHQLLDIGGGFSGQFDDAGHVDLGAVSSAINDALDDAFPEEMGGWRVEAVVVGLLGDARCFKGERLEGRMRVCGGAMCALCVVCFFEGADDHGGEGHAHPPTAAPPCLPPYITTRLP